MQVEDTLKARARRLVQALNEVLGISQEAIAAELGVSFTSVNAWANEKREPRLHSIEMLEVLLQKLTRNPGNEESRFRSAVALLHARYGGPRLGNKEDPLDELFFILLSLKTSFRTYEDTYEAFRQRFYPWEKLLKVSAEEVEAQIRRGGLGSIKARAFVDIAHRLLEDFGKVTLEHLRHWNSDRAQEYLTSLPGVGLKTARCVMMYSLAQDVIAIDTHTYRAGVRLGLVPTSRNPSAAHEAFDLVTPKGLAYATHTNFVAHGRELCLDPTPKCGECPVTHLCSYFTSRAALAVGPKVSRRKPRALLGDAPRAIDVYSGCGGLSLGLRMAGWDVAYALDWDRHACHTHQNNFPECKTECRDVREVSGSEIRDSVKGEIALLAGGPNCQGVSERGLRSPDDPRNFMFPEFVRLVAELRPRAFMMENVPGLAHRHNVGMLKEIFRSFEQLGYRCSGDVLLAAAYGVPQLRYRFVLIGTLEPIDLTLPAPSHSAEVCNDLFHRPYVSVQEAISDLPHISPHRQRDALLEYLVSPENVYQKSMREGSGGVWNHICAATDEINLRRASYIPEGGNWKDIPSELLPDRFFACRMTDHSTTYARLRRDAPAFTITALFGNITAGAFTHPVENRPLSVREGARLQSFPDRFRFFGPRNSQYRQIGNAVPPILAAAVARHLLKLLQGEYVDGVAPRLTAEVLADPRGVDALPVLTPRFKKLFGQATRWPMGWGPEPEDYSEKLTDNYMLRPEYWPPNVRLSRRKLLVEEYAA